MSDAISPRLYRKVALCGVGLIGGSLGMALRDRKLADIVCGYDRQAVVLEKALRKGAIDQGTVRLAEAIEGADLVILAAPGQESAVLLGEVVSRLAKGTIITDVCSTKAAIVHKAEELNAASFFIGGHPMAGSEKAGIEAASLHLMEGATYLLTPTSETDQEALARLEELILGIGARPMVLPVKEHDRLVARISHLPHLLAVVLVEAVRRSSVDVEGRWDGGESVDGVGSEDGEGSVVSGDDGSSEGNCGNGVGAESSEGNSGNGVGAESSEGSVYEEKVLALAAGGFCDLTRIAMGSPALWSDICVTNREAILDILLTFQQELRHVQELIVSGDEDELQRTFEQARSFRSRVPYRRK